MGKRKKKSTEPKKLGRHEWTTPEQKEFLSSKIPAYLAAQSTRTTQPRSDFWVPLWEAYFTQWPMEPESEEEKTSGKVNPARLVKEKKVSTLCAKVLTRFRH
jgi:hypothetical protein